MTVVITTQYLVFESKILDRLSVTGLNLSIKLLHSDNFSKQLGCKKQERNRSISLFCIKKVKLRPSMILLHIYPLQLNYVTTKY